MPTSVCAYRSLVGWVCESYRLVIQSWLFVQQPDYGFVRAIMIVSKDGKASGTELEIAANRRIETKPPSYQHPQKMTA